MKNVNRFTNHVYNSQSAIREYDGIGRGGDRKHEGEGRGYGTRKHEEQRIDIQGQGL